jgi:hypothetical protein
VTISNKNLAEISFPTLTHSSSTSTSWAISAFNSSTSKYMTGLTIHAQIGTFSCVTGFTFTYVDGSTQSTQTTGTTYNRNVSVSFGNSNQWTPQLIKSVNSFVGTIIDRIEICIPPEKCVSAGNENRRLSYSPKIVGLFDVIISFYGTFQLWESTNIDCLTSFGVTYYSKENYKKIYDYDSDE